MVSVCMENVRCDRLQKSGVTLSMQIIMCDDIQYLELNCETVKLNLFNWQNNKYDRYLIVYFLKSDTRYTSIYDQVSFL